MGVHRAGVGTSGGQDAGGTAIKKARVSTSRPLGESVEEEDLGTFQARLQPALADPMARVPSTASKDGDVQGCNAVATTGHEHNMASMSMWYTSGWYQHRAAATESVLRSALRVIGWERVDVTAELRRREGRPTLQLPWDTWASMVPGANAAVYTDTGARHDPDDERGCSVGLDPGQRQVVGGSKAPRDVGQ